MTLVSEELKLVVERAADGVKRRGIADAKIVATRARSVSVVYRDGKPDRVEESMRRSLGVSLYDEGRYAVCETNDFRPGALEELLDTAAALCRSMTPDPARRMTDPHMYEGRCEDDLFLYDDKVASIEPDRRHDYAAALEQAARDAAGGSLISAEAAFQDDTEEVYRVHTNGFEGAVRRTDIWATAEVSLADADDRRPEGYDSRACRWLEDLTAAETLGQGAAMRAVQQLGARRLETAKMPMIVENRAVGRLLGSVLGAASAQAIQQQRSYLQDFLGKPFGSRLLDLRDEPLIPKGLGSRYFDGEGIAARSMPIFTAGALENLYVDTYYGRKLNMTPTTGSRSNVVLTPGDSSLEQLIAGVDRGILVRGFIGGNANPVTGDFSAGIHGTLIENGELTEAVSQMNISGNHKDLWKSLDAVGSDVYTHSTLRCPSLLFGAVQFSGA